MPWKLDVAPRFFDNWQLLSFDVQEAILDHLEILSLRPDEVTERDDSLLPGEFVTRLFVQTERALQEFVIVLHLQRPIHAIYVEALWQLS